MTDAFKMRWREDLEAYFAGQVETDGGLRSWLGRWQDGQGPTRGGTSYATPPEPAAAALESARVARRVERALRLLEPRQRMVLAAIHAPRPPIGLNREAWIAAVLEERVLAALDEEGVGRSDRSMERLREALRSGSAEDARFVLELVPLGVASGVTVLDRLRALSKRPGAPERRLLRRVSLIVQEGERAALEAFEGTWQVAMVEELRERRGRFRASLESR